MREASGGRNTVLPGVQQMQHRRGRGVRRGIRQARRLAPALALALAGVAGFSRVAPAQYVYVPSPPACREDGARSAAARDSVPDPRGVAFLSLEDRPVGGADQYLADAFPLALASRVAVVRGLRVRDHGIVRRLRPTTAADVRSLGRELGVRWLVTGSVVDTRKERGITLQLLDASGGTSAWSQAWDAQTPLVGIERLAAGAIAARISDSLPAAMRMRLDAPRSREPAAYVAFLRGLDHAFEESTAERFLALEAFDEATRLDPAFADAWARSAITAAALLDDAARRDSSARGPLARRALTAADSALRLDSTSVLSWLARADVALLAFGDTRGAVAAYRRAVALDATHPLAHERYGLALLRAGDRARGEAMLRKSIALGPGRAGSRVALAELAARERRDGVACRLLNEAIAAEPYLAYSYVLRADVRVRRNELRNAWADAEIAARLGAPVLAQAMNIIVDARARDTVRAKTRATGLARDLGARSALEPRTGRYLARALLALGRRDEALSTLERVRPVDPAFLEALRDPAFDAVRGSPRFQRMARTPARTASMAAGAP
jgi:TolB-like protein/tetratricopeptide (TPR) repeat protein